MGSASAWAQRVAGLTNAMLNRASTQSVSTPQAPSTRTRQRSRHPFVRNREAGIYFEDFFVCAVVSIVAIRLALQVSGYPQLGGTGFHIAHLLWGGLLMLAAILLLLGFLTVTTRRLAAILAGIGFGLFIDELGKVITADNNYFFRPTVALIYVVFVTVYLIIVAVAHWGRYGPQDCLVNALEIIKEAVVDDLDEAERQHALRYIQQSIAHDPTTDALAHLLTACTTGDAPDSALARLQRTLARAYRGLLARPWLVWVAVAVLALKALLNLGALGLVLLWDGQQMAAPHPVDRGFFAWGGVLTSLAAAVLVLLGLLQVVASRRRAYRTFRVALLVDIFLVQFFAFYESELLALLGLVLSLALLRIVGFAALREQKHWRARSG